MLYSKTCGETSLTRALVSTGKSQDTKNSVSPGNLLGKMDKNLPKPAKYLVHMPGVDGPIWRVRLVVCRVVWCFIEASKTQIFRRIDFWSFGVLLYVMCASLMFLWFFRIFRFTKLTKVHKFRQALWSLAFWNWRHLPFPTAFWSRLSIIWWC